MIEFYQNTNGDHDQLDEKYNSQHWLDIGFQRNNPCTDFRGTGELGLINLHYFTLKYKEEALKIL